MKRRVYMLVRNKYTASLHLRKEDVATYIAKHPLVDPIPWYDDLSDGVYEVYVSDETFIKVAESECGIKNTMCEGSIAPGAEAIR
jgi:hypothetical protein